MNEIVERSGGWFVKYPEGTMGGPWRTKEAALLASKGLYIDASKAERDALGI